MKRVTSGLAALGLAALGLAASLGLAYASPSTATSAPPVSGGDRVDQKKDEFSSPMEDKRRALREAAITGVR